VPSDRGTPEHAGAAATTPTAAPARRGPVDLLSDTAVRALLTSVVVLVLVVAGWVGYRVHGSLGSLTGLAIGALVLGVGWMLLVLTGARELLRIRRQRRLAAAGREVRTRG
jgi:glycerol uptake facilitator-like aquaporin